MKDDSVKVDFVPQFNELLRAANIQVRYKWGKGQAGAGLFTAAQAEQVILFLNPFVRRVFGESAAITGLNGFTGRYEVVSKNGVEGRGKNPREAMADSHIIRTALKTMCAESKGGQSDGRR